MVITWENLGVRIQMETIRIGWRTLWTKITKGGHYLKIMSIGLARHKTETQREVWGRWCHDITTNSFFPPRLILDVFIVLILKAQLTGTGTHMEPEPTFNGTTEFDLCYHLSTYAFSESSLVCVLVYVFLGSVCLVTVFGNLLVIFSIIYFKQLHTPTNYLILSLAVADLLIGVLVFPLSFVFNVTYCWYYEDLFCKIRGCFDVTLSTASILNLCCISIDRYHAVCEPLTYRSKINNRVIVIMVLVSWGLAWLIGIGIITAGFNQGKCEENCFLDTLISTTLACIFSFYIPVIIMLCIYLKIFLVAQRQANSIQNQASHCNKSGAAVSKMERKATKILATVMGVFLLCWTPYFLYLIFQPLTHSATPIAVIETLNWLTLSNSMLNPFIYAFFYSWFRSAFRMIISGKIFRRDFANTRLF